MTSSSTKNRRTKSRTRRQTVDQRTQTPQKCSPGWGGRRPGAGRKAAGKFAGVPHRSRPDPPSPALGAVHVMLRVRGGLPSLRQARCMKVIRSVLVAAKATSPMRIVHFCVQRDHLHLIIEADEREAFLSGIRGLTIQLSKRLNAALLLSGRLWADRYQAEELNSFSQLRQALVFVLNNRLWHSSRRGGQTKPAKTIDPCSSGLTFDGWRGIKAKALTLEPAVEEPRGFALRRGWRRHGLIAIDELPGGSFAEPPEG